MNTDLRHLLDSDDFETEGAVRLASVQWNGAECRVVLAVDFGDEPARRQHWEFTADTVHAHSIVCGDTDDLDLTADHVILALFRDEQVTLSFAGLAPDPRHVVADLWAAHSRVADGWFDFRDFMNELLPLTELIASGSGVLATGPSRLMEAYARVLTAHGLGVSHSAKRPAPVPAAEVLVWGNSWLAGTGITSARISDRAAVA